METFRFVMTLPFLSFGVIGLWSATLASGSPGAAWSSSFPFPIDRAGAFVFPDLSQDVVLRLLDPGAHGRPGGPEREDRDQYERQGGDERCHHRTGPPSGSPAKSVRTNTTSASRSVSDRFCCIGVIAEPGIPSSSTARTRSALGCLRLKSAGGRRSRTAAGPSPWPSAPWQTAQRTRNSVLPSTRRGSSRVSAARLPRLATYDAAALRSRSGTSRKRGIAVPGTPFQRTSVNRCDEKRAAVRLAG